jgi:hypothetical protein
MPLRNRVTPLGEIVAVSARGTLMGNRGILHDPTGMLRRDSQVRRWIACRLEFRGRHRQVMTPGTWTELFFLDEATALAAGHRPCAECRHADFRAFQEAWRTAFPHASVQADAMDATLHAERRIRPWVKRTYVDPDGGALPHGTIVELEGRAWLVQGEVWLAWSAEGYREPRAPVSGEVSVLTPQSIVGVLRAGYRASLHPTARVMAYQSRHTTIRFDLR